MCEKLLTLSGEITLVDACRKHDLKQSEVESWVNEFIKSGTQGLKKNGKDSQDEQEKKIKDMQAKIGELVLELDARKKLQALYDQDEDES
jgi:transposase-like protein